jgi:hypothetical protein
VDTTVVPGCVETTVVPGCVEITVLTAVVIYVLTNVDVAVTVDPWRALASCEGRSIGQLTGCRRYRCSREQSSRRIRNRHILSNRNTRSSRLSYRDALSLRGCIRDALGHRNALSLRVRNALSLGSGGNIAADHSRYERVHYTLGY